MDKASPRTFNSLAVSDPDGLIFGKAPRPVECGLGLTIGGGEVYPELNFTLPPMLVSPETWPAARQIYASVMDATVERTRDLGLSGLVVEFEHLPPMTAEPEWGAELTGVIKSRLRKAHEAWGLKSAVRVTVVDLREETKPPLRRRGPSWERMRQSLELCSQAGGDILSIESTGGKEVHDAALTRGDLPGIVLALGILAPRDMSWLWDQFVEVANRYGVTPGGDTACGFANTAMQLAGKKMLPDVLAALVRAMCSVRSLVAYERGAVGPSKDCAYEGPVMKAIAGCPISMEGRSATCAHLSPVGNIAGAMADLWSNESVPDVRLLSGSAVIASLESLVYDCRLFNAGTQRGAARALRDLHVDSDARLSAQAALLTPEATVAIGKALVAEKDAYARTVAVANVAVNLLNLLKHEGRLALPPREATWLERLRKAVDELPPTADRLLAQTQARYGELYDPASYGL